MPLSLALAFGSLPPWPIPDVLEGDDPTFEHRPVDAVELRRALTEALALVPLPNVSGKPIHRFRSGDPLDPFEFGFLQAGHQVRSLHCDRYTESSLRAIVVLAQRLGRDLLVLHPGGQLGACVGAGETLDVVRARLQSVLGVAQASGGHTAPDEGLLPPGGETPIDDGQEDRDGELDETDPGLATVDGEPPVR